MFKVEPVSMPSAIDPSLFADGRAVSKAELRMTLAAASSEIEALQQAYTFASEYGVVGDGLTDDTEALQSLWRALARGETRTRRILLPPRIRVSSLDRSWENGHATRLDRAEGFVIEGSPTTFVTDENDVAHSCAIRIAGCSDFVLSKLGVEGVGSARRDRRRPSVQSLQLARIWGPGRDITIDRCFAKYSFQLCDLLAAEPKGDIYAEPLRNVTLRDCFVVSCEHGVHTAGVVGLDLELACHGDFANGGAGIQRAFWCGCYTHDVRGKLFVRDCMSGSTSGAINFSTDLLRNVDIQNVELHLNCQDLNAAIGVRMRVNRLKNQRNAGGGILRPIIRNVRLKGVLTGCSHALFVETDPAKGVNDAGAEPPLVGDVHLDNLVIDKPRVLRGRNSSAISNDRARPEGAQLGPFTITNGSRLSTTTSQAVALDGLTANFVARDSLIEALAGDVAPVVELTDCAPTVKCILDGCRIFSPNANNPGVRVEGGELVDRDSVMPSE